MIIAVYLFVRPSAAHASVIFVKPTGNNANNGLSWNSAKQTVAGGLAAATGGDQVWVSAGTYIERISLKLDVALYGGFAGNEDPATFNLADRNFAANMSTLDGNFGGTVVTGPQGATAACRIDGFTITHGKSARGGGLFIFFASPAIVNNTFVDNTATDSGGGLYVYQSSSPTIANNTIANNTAANFGGGLSLDSFCSPIVSNNTIIGNRASKYGGGVYLVASSPTFTNNAIAGNAASTTTSFFCRGGGIALFSSSPTIANSTIVGNSVYSSNGNSYGGGLYMIGSSPIIANTTVAGNSATTDGGGLYLTLSSPSSSPTIVNTIFAFNNSGIRVDGTSGAPVLQFNCVFGNTAYNYVGLTDPTGTNGNISADPVFNDLVGGDVRLQPSSPCIDAGDSNFMPLPGADLDLDGHLRVCDGNGDGISRVDMGAYEFGAPACPGDVNGDNVIDLLDLTQLLANYGKSGDATYADGDLNGDRIVDLSDLAQALAHYGSDCP